MRRNSEEIGEGNEEEGEVEKEKEEESERKEGEEEGEGGGEYRSTRTDITFYNTCSGRVVMPKISIYN